MFRVKICGITNVDDARAAAEAGADAVGLNFYSGSPRCVSLAEAEQIAAVLPSRVRRIGVFVNSPVEAVRAAHERLRLDAVQLHGDEPPEFVAQLSDLRLVRAFRLASDQGPAVRHYLAACDALGARFEMILLDAYRPGEYGGTGAVGDWSLAAELAADKNLPPVVLAGGLNADNVARAIGQVRPAAVDTASGVELTPRNKSRDLMRSFLERAESAFAGLEGERATR